MINCKKQSKFVKYTFGIKIFAMDRENRKYDIFISSTYEDLKEERAEVSQAILELGYIPSAMESFPATNETQWEYIKEKIKKSDYFILIVGGKYGSIYPETGLSYTEMEFRYAEEIGIPTIAFLIKDGIDLPQSKIDLESDKIQKMNALKDYLKGKRVCKFYTSKDNLRAVIATSLVNLISRYPRNGWVRSETIEAGYLPKEETLLLKEETEKLKKEIEENESRSKKNEKQEDLRPHAILQETVFFSTEEDCKAIIGKSLLHIRNYFQHIIVFDAFRCKQINIKLSLESHSREIRDSWSMAYRSISILNNFIEIAEGGGMPLSNMSYYLATVKILRALVYVDMIQHWGDVPFANKPVKNIDGILIPKTDKQTIYSSLLQDLQEATLTLTDRKNQLEGAMVSSTLADALTGIIYLELNNPEEAAITFKKKIIDFGIFEMCADRSIIYNQINNKDSIFSLSNQPDLSDNYEPFKSIRKGLWHPLYRYTGVLLNYAEALYKMGQYSDALQIIEQIKTYFDLNQLNLSTESIPTNIASLWNHTIGNDYGYFALLKRLNLIQQELNIEGRELLFPIPQEELDNNCNLTQNPGY